MEINCYFFAFPRLSTRMGHVKVWGSKKMAVEDEARTFAPHPNDEASIPPNISHTNRRTLNFHRFAVVVVVVVSYPT
ncbi:hypothetical protein TNIN_435391 [Trichonephila inaurata madagascariensis]|uniref:Uncharacterized protein n=1 Tax=Trichonephila inaurata madagascariensis TaxID=2747483 RepID=A0A8X6XBA9_9ARAC|nr:hypothetical protein TNIN_435391 [Trichonephila inaurata madagascariensis]